MGKLKGVLKFIKKMVEVYIPVISFLIMFVVFIVQVFSRYVILRPIPWAYEVTVTAYLWLVILGAVFAQRDNAHVRFTLFYDKLTVKNKTICAFIGNLLMAIAFIYSFIPSLKFINFMKIQETSVLHLSLRLIYAPYIFFLLFIIAYILIDMYDEFLVFSGIGGKDSERKLLEGSKTESLEIIEDALDNQEVK